MVSPLSLVCGDCPTLCFPHFLSHFLFTPPPVFAHSSGDQYALKMRFVDHVFDEQVIDSLTVKIILPEGAK
jgi:hypothetical protein